MHWRKSAVAVAVIVAFCFPVAFAFAQTQERGGMHGQGQQGHQVEHQRTGSMTGEMKIDKASDLMNRTVKNPEGQDLGKIENLAIDPDNGRIAYAVLSFGGFLGMGNKLFAIPWQSLQLQGENKYVLNVEKSKLKNAPGFEKDNWPDMANPRFGTEVYGHYGETPYWEKQSRTGTREQRPTRICKASQIIGEEVKNASGQDLGKVENLAVDVTDGRVAYAVVSSGGFLDIGDKEFAVPWKALNVQRNNEITLDVSKEKLKDSPQFEKNEWSQMTSKQFLDKTYSYYNVQPYWESGTKGTEKP